MKCFVGFLAFTALTYFASLPLVLAEQPMTREMQQSYEKHRSEKNKKNFIGWNGILFYCFFNDKSPQAQKDICEQADVDVEFLAATAKLDLIKTHSPYDVAFLAEVEKRLVLEVDVSLTTQGSPAAVSARVMAYMDLSYAVEESPWQDKKGNIRTLPRSGKLIVWEEAVLGASSGTSQDLVTPVSQGIEQHLKKFFAEYLKAQR